jgi:hypothetical protein
MADTSPRVQLDGFIDRYSPAIFSLAAYPRWVNLFFLDGAQLDDPDGILKGRGGRVRRIALESAATLDDPKVRTLMTRALAASDKRIDRTARRQTIVKSVSRKQRPRRPTTRRPHVR